MEDIEKMQFVISLISNLEVGFISLFIELAIRYFFDNLNLKKESKNKKLSIFTMAPKNQILYRKSIKGEVKILFEENEICNLYKSRIIVKNTGNESIHFLKISILTKNISSKILKIIYYDLKSNYSFDVEIIPFSNNDFQIKIPYLNPGEKAIFFAFTDVKTEIICKHRQPDVMTTIKSKSSSIFHFF